MIEKKEMIKVLDALFLITGNQTGIESKAIVDSIMKRMDKNGDNVLQLDEFLDGCLEDETTRKILIDPMFNC